MITITPKSGSKFGGKTLPSNFNIEHLIMDSDGTLRPLRPEDVDIDYNKGVRDAFKMIYQWHRQKEKYTNPIESTTKAWYKSKNSRT